MSASSAPFVNKLKLLAPHSMFFTQIIDFPTSCPEVDIKNHCRGLKFMMSNGPHARIRMDDILMNNVSGNGSQSGRYRPLGVDGTI
ncbi:hypothetical protein T10_8638 [Trichinella papuae]|uniref:Uncharacterized protein n=1 Tax=Trichinella papuae TaxID=268474 RepID=A0A0V1M3R0_9BILA|nr:hypothetical protein T10_8638 [Trichinella papuae]